MPLPWPSDLPRFSIPDTRSITYEQAVREFAADIGSPIRRVARSSSARILSGTYRMTTAQLDTFWNFYNVLLNNGVDQFTIRDVNAGEDVTVEFLSSQPPEAREIMRGRHDIDLAFRVL